MRILLVEDDELLGSGIARHLELDGHAVDWIKNGSEVDAYLQAQPYSVVILDLGLPGKPGLEVLQAMRREHNPTPVLILTARDTSADKVQGLDSGADDYLVKPFDIDELNARLRALARRHAGRAEAVIRHGDITLDPAAHTVQRGGRHIELSPREFTILQRLLEHPGRVVSRAALEECLYSWDQEVDSNTVQVHIHHIRKKLGAEVIRTVRGVGYVIDNAP